MQQLWDKLRRKVNDVQSKLPAGAGPSVVNDDFGDVLGVFYGLTGKSHTYRELEDEAKIIKNELLKIKDVAKIEIYGIQTPTIDVSVSPSVMAQSGITTSDIARAFEAQNKVVDAGGIDAGQNRLRIESTGNFYSLDDIRNLTIVSRSGEHFRLADIAQIEESYQTPASNLMRIDGNPAIGIAISTVPTGNVVDMAEAVKKRIDELSQSMPEGYELTSIYDQGYESAVANQGFVLNLIISVLTVIAILLFFIGFKNGTLIGSGLIFFHLRHSHCHDGLRHRTPANVTGRHHYRHGDVGRQCHCCVRLRFNQYGAWNAETCSHHAGLLDYRPALVGSNRNRYSYFPSYLLFTTYHR